MTETAAPAEKTVYQPKVGDMFVSSWGYDQTNVDFYKVVGVTASGKSVKVQRWQAATVETEHDHFTSEHVVAGGGPVMVTKWDPEMPANVDYWERQKYSSQVPAPIETKRLRVGGYKDASFAVNSYSHAFLWDGKPEYKTASGFGH